MDRLITARRIYQVSLPKKSRYHLLHKQCILGFIVRYSRLHPHPRIYPSFSDVDTSLVSGFIYSLLLHTGMTYHFSLYSGHFLHILILEAASCSISLSPDRKPKVFSIVFNPPVLIAYVIHKSLAHQHYIFYSLLHVYLISVYQIPVQVYDNRVLDDILRIPAHDH